MAEIQETSFGKLADGREARLFTMRNARGTEVAVTTYGARLTAWRVKDAKGTVRDIVLGLDSIMDYVRDTTFLGAVIGRHANRIGGATFTINKKRYDVEKNDGPTKANHLHGGSCGFHQKLWQGKATDDSVLLQCFSADGEGGYPGNMQVCVRYRLTDEDALVIEYTAESDADTVCNLTNHAYFNMAGVGKGMHDVLSQKVQIFSDSFTPADAQSLPDGRILPVDGTPMDLREPTAIGAHIEDDYDQLNMAGGYDHNWVLSGKAPSLAEQASFPIEKMKKAACAASDETGLILTCYTTQPGLQFYTGNFLTGAKGKDGCFHPRYAFCFETQFFPNAFAHPNFPQPILRKGERFHAKTVYALTKEK